MATTIPVNDQLFMEVDDTGTFTALRAEGRLLPLVTATTDPVTGVKYPSNTPGFFGHDRPTLLFTWDHPYSQLGGKAGYDSVDQWFRDYGLFPYCLTTNTKEGTNVSPGALTGNGNMSWAEIAALQANGVEITNHANRHLQNMARVCTGVQINYWGPNATATAHVTDSPRTLHLVDSVDNTFDLTNASYDTVAELVAAVNALGGGGKWSMVAEDELDGTERSADMLILASPGVDVKAGTKYLALSGGLLIRYKGSTYKTAMVKSLLGTYIQLFGDGCLVAEYQFASASYNTLTKVSTVINALESGAWECNVIDNAATYPQYCSGSEATSGNLLAGDFQDCHHRYVWLSAGLPISTLWRKMLQKAKTVAASHGVAMKNFSDVGGGAWAQVVAQISEFTNLARCSAVLSTIAPGAVPVDVAWTVPIFSYETTNATNAQTAAVIPALESSPGFVCAMFTHMIKEDGASGRTFVPQSDAQSTSHQSETKMLGYLANVKAAVDSRSLNVMTHQGFFTARKSMPAPRNRIFNPKWKNSGESLVGLDDYGRAVPGWHFKTPNISSLTVDADGVLTLTNASYIANGKHLRTMVWLNPGATYHVSITVETIAWTNDNGGVSIALAPAYGYEYLNEVSATVPGAQGVYIVSPEYAGKTLGSHRYMNAEFTTPLPKRKPAYIKGRIAGPFDLSTNKNIQINIDGIGSTGDIDCSSGASSSSAVLAWEAAAAINAKIKATAAYAGKSQYFNVASAVDGKLILQSPYESASSPNQGGIIVSNGSTLNARDTLFGTPVNGAEPPRGIATHGSLSTMLPYFFTIYVNGMATYRISSPVISDINGMF